MNLLLYYLEDLVPSHWACFFNIICTCYTFSSHIITITLPSRYFNMYMITMIELKLMTSCPVDLTSGVSALFSIFLETSTFTDWILSEKGWNCNRSHTFVNILLIDNRCNLFWRAHLFQCWKIPIPVLIWYTQHMWHVVLVIQACLQAYTHMSIVAVIAIPQPNSQSQS